MTNLALSLMFLISMCVACGQKHPGSAVSATVDDSPSWVRVQCLVDFADWIWVEAKCKKYLALEGLMSLGLMLTPFAYTVVDILCVLE